MRRRTDAAVYACVACVALVAIFGPLFSATYPPMTDLPFHAAQTSAFRHWLDGTFHYRDQFELQPLRVPYVSSYLLGALFMLVFPVTTAVKLATGVMLLLLPAGLATLAWGMRKSPLLGLLGVPFAWCHLVHWGFINFVAALGLFAMALGLALRALDAPSRRVRIALGTVLVVLFFTHVYRYPFAIAGVIAATAVTYPVHRRIAPVVLPLVPSLVLFSIFWAVRPSTLEGGLGPMRIEPARWAELFPALVDGFDDPAEATTAVRHAWVVLFAAAIALVLWVVRLRGDEPIERRRAVLTTLVPLGGALGCLWLFFTLPMDIGNWWYVYPREATAAAFLAMGVFPDLPRSALARGAILLALSFSVLTMSSVVTKNFRAFDATTRDFTAIAKEIPRAPKLLYLIFDHHGSTRTTTPYIHLPAWIQAEKGGWLSFHFSVMGSSPLRYREDPGAVVPPAVPPRWEWTPEKFDVTEHGAFFDWFLVRRAKDPSKLFRDDPDIVLLDHKGNWWLYARRSAEAAR